MPFSFARKWKFRCHCVSRKTVYQMLFGFFFCQIRPLVHKGNVTSPGRIYLFSNLFRNVATQIRSREDILH